MTPAALLNDLMGRGIHLSASGGKLVAEGPVDLLNDDLKTVLAKHKSGLMPLVAVNWARKASHLLNKINDPHTRADLRERFEERAGICEFDGNLPRDEAERLAFEEIRSLVERVVAR